MTLGSCSPDVWRTHFFIKSISTFDKYLAYYTLDVLALIRLYLKLFWNFRTVDIIKKKFKKMQHAQRVNIYSFLSDAMHKKVKKLLSYTLKFGGIFSEILNEKFNKRYTFTSHYFRSWKKFLYIYKIYIYYYI